MKTLFLILSLVANLSSAHAKTIVGKVLSIHDGDTLTFLPEGTTKKAKLRLMGVDTPEIDFNGATQGEVAEKARDFLMKLIPLNSTIQVSLGDQDTDSNGRYLGQIFYNGLDINLEILKAGWGVTYFIFPYDKKIVVSYEGASKLASDQHLGIFSDLYKAQPFGYMFRQHMKGVPGTNIVADYELKKLFSSDTIESVPHYHRVFFSSEETAVIHGFNW